MASYATWSFRLCLVVILSGCGSQHEPTIEDIKKMNGGTLKEVVPVSGHVTVDGEAKNAVYIQVFRPMEGTPICKTKSDENGSFCLVTYTACDGLEPGEYKLTFKWMPKVNRKGVGEDLLNGRYDHPSKSEIKLKVEKGVPQKDVKFDLLSK